MLNPIALSITQIESKFTMKQIQNTKLESKTGSRD